MAPQVTKMVRKKSKGGSRLDRRLVPGSGKPSNTNQIVYKTWVQHPFSSVNSANTTGIINSAVTPSIATLTNYNSLKALYDEGRILEIRFLVVALQNNSGQTKVWLDDADATAPTTTSAKTVRGVMVPNSLYNAKSSHKFHYKCEDLDDLDWRTMSSNAGTEAGYTPVALKLYSDFADYATTVNTQVFQVWAELLCEFRGLGAP